MSEADKEMVDSINICGFLLLVSSITYLGVVMANRDLAMPDGRCAFVISMIGLWGKFAFMTIDDINRANGISIKGEYRCAN